MLPQDLLHLVHLALQVRRAVPLLVVVVPLLGDVAPDLRAHLEAVDAVPLLVARLELPVVAAVPPSPSRPAARVSRPTSRSAQPLLVARELFVPSHPLSVLLRCPSLPRTAAEALFPSPLLTAVLPLLEVLLASFPLAAVLPPQVVLPVELRPARLLLLLVSRRLRMQ